MKQHVINQRAWMDLRSSTSVYGVVWYDRGQPHHDPKLA
eukprot:CAMPEP_0198108852 /NCGR_PEP_ID=MMETSP1442-20131203/886_1 /TAXON_ID= /ORGANISM="Craspedostauros australis, Strain CCMP3328" /LENGTH=38 /DNA_ID= /DNA_START= /DNA_END= /DNA_ORIENTATION=